MAAGAAVLVPAADAPVPFVVADAGRAVDCAALAVPCTTAWVVSWTMPVTAVTGADGDTAAWGAGSVLASGAGMLAAGVLDAEGLATGALATGALATGAGVLPAEAAVSLVVWLAGAGWAEGGAAAAVPWTAWVAPWTTPPTAEAAAGEAVWVAVPVPGAVVVAAAGALAAGVLGAGGSAAGVLGAAALAAGPTEEATDDAAEEADEATDDTTSPAA